MSGRRRHERFAPAQPWDGALRVLRDVIVQEDPSGGLVTIGQAPGVIGEQMMLDVAGAGHVVTLKVRVPGEVVLNCDPLATGPVQLVGETSSHV